MFKKIFSYLTVFLIVFNIFPVFSMAVGMDTNSVNVNHEENGIIRTGDFDIMVTCGLDGNYRCGKTKIPVNVKIKSINSDFTGKIRIVVPGSDDSASVAYESDISVMAGSENTVNIFVYSNSQFSNMEFQLQDTDGKTIIDKNVKVTGKVTEDTLIGVFSGNYDALGYFDDIVLSMNGYVGSTKLIELSSDNITADGGIIDMLSYIIINDFDTEVFTDEQVEGFKKWINNGGVLLISTDTKDYKNFKAFDGVLFDSNKEKVFGKDYIKYIGNGSLMISKNSFSLNLNKDNQKNIDFAKNILLKSAAGKPAYHIVDLNYNYSNNPGYNINECLKGLYKVKLPDINLIGYILIGFCLIVGPVGYLFLKLIKKRRLLWIFVPVISACAAAAILYISKDIKILESMSSSVSSFYYDSDDSENSSRKDISMSVMFPKTKREYFTLNKKLNGIRFSEYEKYQRSENSKDTELLLTETSDGSYKVGIDNKEPFSYLYMSANDSSYEKYEKDKKTTDISVDIIRKSTSLSGKVINNTNYNLDTVAVCSNNIIVPIGSLMPGEERDFIERDNVIFNRNAYYDLGAAGFKNLSDHGSKYATLKSMWSYFADAYLSSIDTKDVYTYGVALDYTEDYISDDNIKENNAAIYVRRDSATLSDYNSGYNVDLFSYCKQADGWDFNDGQIYNIKASGEFDLSSEIDKIYAIVCEKDNIEADLIKNTKIYGYNVETKKYDELFKDGDTMEFSGKCPYIDKSGIMKLQFTCKNVNEDYCPKISVIGGK